MDVVVDRGTLSASSRDIAGLAQLRAQIGIALNGRRIAAGETDVKWGNGEGDARVITVTDRFVGHSDSESSLTRSAS